MLTSGLFLKLIIQTPLHSLASTRHWLHRKLLKIVKGILCLNYSFNLQATYKKGFNSRNTLRFSCEEKDIKHTYLIVFTAKVTLINMYLISFSFSIGHKVLRVGRGGLCVGLHNLLSLFVCLLWPEIICNQITARYSGRGGNKMGKKGTSKIHVLGFRYRQSCFFIAALKLTSHYMTAEHL